MIHDVCSAADETLLRVLADGEFHSGSRLADRLGVSRTAVWKRIRALGELGLDVAAAPGRGYRLDGGLDLLDAAVVMDVAGPVARQRLVATEFLACTDSTNSRLLRREPPPAGHGHLCIADYQSTGRGRRGRQWNAPYASGICLSLGWTFPTQPPDFSALSLVAGIASVRALEATGLDGLSLKWPNDLLCATRKLGGILIEIRGEADGPVHVVTGIGINFRLPETARREIAATAAIPPTDLAACHSRPPRRSECAGLVTRHLVDAFETFASAGFAPFAADFAARDAVAGREVTLQSGERAICGTGAGVDRDGALLLDTAAGQQRFYGGEVSLRFDR